MTLEWGSLPLLPLRCILDYLSTEDALAAMSTCRHWRNAILLYEGRKDTLKLRARHMNKTLLLTRLFRRYTQALHVYLDGKEDEIEELVNFVLPQYFDTVQLRELIFIGPSYIQQNHYVPFYQLKRILIEGLFLKNIESIKTFALMGCDMTPAEDVAHDIHKHAEYYSRDLLFCRTILDSSTYYTGVVTHIIVDYSQISTAFVQALWPLRQLRHLTLNITNRRASWQRVDWPSVQRKYTNPLQVSLNIVAVPYRRFNEIMDNILVDRLNLVTLKVLFCKSLYTPLLSHVSRMYAESLLEVVWADSPYESDDPYHRIVRPMQRLPTDSYAHVNPFVLLCWQCLHLRRLVIHGYWIWHYDILGFVRLRKTLTTVDISAIYSKQGQFEREIAMSEEGTARVMLGDSLTLLDSSCIDEVNEYTEFKWQPTPVSSLHPALRAHSSPAQRCDYVFSETSRPLGVTLY